MGEFYNTDLQTGKQATKQELRSICQNVCYSYAKYAKISVHET